MKVIVGLILLTALPGSIQTFLGCPRFPEGSTLSDPPTIRSKDGTLTVDLYYRTSIDEYAQKRYCYMMSLDDNELRQSPTLRVKRGDRLILRLHNTQLPAAANHSAGWPNNHVCGSRIIDSTSTNIHFHGTHTSPRCHGDQVIYAVINAGQTFEVELYFPKDHPTGMFWYHPHLHGISEAAVMGGASGVLIVEGLENIHPSIDRMRERIIVVRDSLLIANTTSPDAPAWDLSVNYRPVRFPNYTVPVIRTRSVGAELWRVLNAAADANLNLQLQFDGVPQFFRVLALDGYPLAEGEAFETDVLKLPPASRAEVVAPMPSHTVRNATLITLRQNTGPVGDNTPTRPIAHLVHDDMAPLQPELLASNMTSEAVEASASSLHSFVPSIIRELVFANDAVNDKVFYITVVGHKQSVFNASAPPSIVTRRGNVEDWIIYNTAHEEHDFHIHQLHFVILEVDGVPVPPNEVHFRDTVRISFASPGQRTPSVRVRMQFNIPGEFVYHCHILQHEDGGMMAKMVVKVEH